MALLEVDRIVAGYVAGIDILNGLQLHVESGTITGIIGPNGAGKSTLLKTIFGFLQPRQGSIIFDGREIQRLSPHTIKRLGISYAPQGMNIFPHLTVQEKLKCSPSPKNRSPIRPCSWWTNHRRGLRRWSPSRSMPNCCRPALRV